MATIALKKRRKRVQMIGPADNGMIMTPGEFDRLDYEDCEEGWRYELLNGVLIVSPIPSVREVDPNEELGRLLRNYREMHAKGRALDKTLPERIVYLGDNRRRPDRVIWAGLGRVPRSKELPTIIAEFVSKRKRDRLLDYETKRDEYIDAGVKEYWVIDRFQRVMTVFYKTHGKIRRKLVQTQHTYRTDYLPGFELRIADLFAIADDWTDDHDDDQNT
jgi:Uma2 family endonuclease